MKRVIYLFYIVFLAQLVSAKELLIGGKAYPLFITVPSLLVIFIWFVVFLIYLKRNFHYVSNLIHLKKKEQSSLPPPPRVIKSHQEKAIIRLRKKQKDFLSHVDTILHTKQNSLKKQVSKEIEKKSHVVAETEIKKRIQRAHWYLGHNKRQEARATYEKLKPLYLKLTERQKIHLYPALASLQKALHTRLIEREITEPNVIAVEEDEIKLKLARLNGSL